jgi:formylglycine-generating enzyme required for sulfatase activity
VLVEWADANAYCQWVGKRLPSEAEWEKTARGSDGRIYPWGDEWDSSRLKIHWVRGEGFTTAPVGSYPQGASPYGALDMAGNAPEWVSDRYRVYPSGRYTETSIWVSGPFIRRGGYRSSIVGSADPPELHYRVADRFPGDERALSGFRCVRGLEPPPLRESIVSAEHYTQPTPLAEVDLTGMVKIPAGEFQMGSDDSDLYPAHTVYLDTFSIDRYETTHAKYVEFLNALGATYYACNGVTCVKLRPPDEDMHLYSRPSHIIKVDGQFVVEEGYEDYPAVTVSWEGADAYCRWRGKRLPTDAEWEKAARGVHGLVRPWRDQGSYPPSFSRSEAPVGSCPDDVSPYGVWDIIGRVDEWVSGWYDHDYYKDIPYDNPTGYEQPAEDHDRVYRPTNRPLYDRSLTAGGPWHKSGVRCAYTP